MTETIGGLGGKDHPSVTVYGDGLVVAHYPAGMRRAGDHTVRLSRTELDALVQSLAAKGVLDFDAAAARRARDDADRARRAAGQVLTVSSDVDLTEIEVTVDRGTSRAVWAGVREDARQHPQVVAIRNLAAARDELQALMDRAYGQGR